MAGLLAGTVPSAATPPSRATTRPGQPSPAAAAPVPWRDCGDGFQCATVKVPLDYDEPNGRLIDLALARLPASDPAHRIGSLFINPGGPGGSGKQIVLQGARLLYPPGVRARFDLVGFDPRGVAESTPVRCFGSSSEQQAFFQDYPSIPITRQEMRQARSKVRELARRCQARAGWLLPHVSTADVARDLDLLRARVGDRRLSYVGYSYGTYLGVTYANLFPDRIRAMALDAVIDAPAYTTGPQPSTTFVRANSDRGSAATLREFLRLCTEAASRCAFGATGDPARKFATLAARLREEPARSPDGSTFGYADLLILTVETLYLPWLYDDLAGILQELYAATTPSATPRAMTAAITRARALQTAGSTRPPTRAAAEDPYNNRVEAAYASVCGETANPRTLRGFRQSARMADRRSRYVGRYWAYTTLPCLAWPTRAQDRYAGPWSARTSAPILLVNNRFDPATPHQNAVTMDRLIPRSRLMTVNGWAHTALQTRSPCADGTIERYLVRLTLPRAGATCETGVVPFADVPSAQRRLLPDGVLPAPRF